MMNIFKVCFINESNLVLFPVAAIISNPGWPEFHLESNLYPESLDEILGISFYMTVIYITRIKSRGLFHHQSVVNNCLNFFMFYYSIGV